MTQAKKHFRKRDAILAYLRSTDVHPSADMVFANLKPEIPDLSLGTVYRNLSMFRQEGTIASVGTVNGVERFDGNLLCVADLAQLPRPLEQLKGGFGLFYQGFIQSLEELLPLLTPKVQTLVCGGLSPQEVSAWLMKRRAKGIYRVVPPGQALELDTLWDGKDVIGCLSRIIG